MNHDVYDPRRLHYVIGVDNEKSARRDANTARWP